MPLVTLKEILQNAVKNNYAVGMFNGVGLEFFKGIIEASEELDSPVIIGFAERFIERIDFETLAFAVKQMAERSFMPIALHLDHAKNLKNIIMAIKLGFTSIMYDGSSLDFEDNIKSTMEIVKIAHSIGISVEGELGTIGRGDWDFTNADYYTKPQDAVEFVERTGVDALAVAIGTVHGKYMKEPKLDIGRLKEIKNAVEIPLVLHGGSGLTDEDFRNCIKNGIRKVNIFTDLGINAENRIRNLVHVQKDDLFPDIYENIKNAVKEETAKKILIFGSKDKAKEDYCEWADL